ncbi:TIGR03885 family FMN-dependent LLM class oxidoreductase [Iamia sp. SCSIO 61187]|uniref:TIGR03885 family FMN-dependent LLM class oxidoreductase n=1 Tax=Iamia sp. SCSIO 61187 TaxID=2722752 RepID=UPI001C62743B|nr:TIGR03885 family FMN-dependent LLM class oxidoreductase [Iamia sp. SCSIO 61187]QYG93200.1 TIGR03885 family FMN-dependent LLM class oxidoreductase [Iamia sp. SCSIO 61187]
MTIVGFHASHEQIHPAALLEAVQRAESAGFTAGMCSDHFAPWSARQGQSGFAWSWLGAALATTGLTYGVVNAPGQRYHPAIIAQAAASLSAMFPGRLWVALGSGEASNEHITGDGWPRKEVRNARLLECVEVMRALFAGEEVSHDGLVTVDRARLWTLPEEPPALIGAAVSVETAAWVAGWADGLVTVNQPVEQLRRVVDAYRSNGGRGRMAVQVHVSYAADDDAALAIAHDQWRTNVVGPPVSWDTDSVEAFDLVGERIRPEDMHGTVLISSDPARHVAWIEELAEVGFDMVNLHHVGQDQREFIDTFGERVLPELEVTRP